MSANRDLWTVKTKVIVVLCAIALASTVIALTVGPKWLDTYRTARLSVDAQSRFERAFRSQIPVNPDSVKFSLTTESIDNSWFKITGFMDRRDEKGVVIRSMISAMLRRDTKLPEDYFIESMTVRVAGEPEEVIRPGALMVLTPDGPYQAKP